MKRLWLFAVLAVSLTLFSTSCDPDPVVDPPVETNFAPSVTLLGTNPNVNGGNVFSSDATIELEGNGATTIFVGIEGSDSTPPMRDIEIFRNGEKPDGVVASIIADNGTIIGDSDPNTPEAAPSNPALLVSPFDEGFKFEVGLRTADAYGVNTFDITLTDSEGLTSTTTIVITTVELVPTTDITVDFIGGVIFNADGPNLGAFDLDNLEAVSSSSDLAELQDDGINTDLPATSNWRRTISPENGAVIKVVDRSALGENYSFATVTTKEQIQAAWDTGTTVVGSTDVITTDTELVVDVNGTYYLILFTDVVATDNNNEDFYVMDIKS